jgi:hypothetical protein
VRRMFRGSSDIIHKMLVFEPQIQMPFERFGDGHIIQAGIIGCDAATSRGRVQLSDLENTVMNPHVTSTSLLVWPNSIRSLRKNLCCGVRTRMLTFK